MLTDIEQEELQKLKDLRAHHPSGKNQQQLQYALNDALTMLQEVIERASQQIDAKNELLAAYEGTRFPVVGADLIALGESLKDAPKPGECRQVPPNVSEAIDHLQVALTPIKRTELDEVYNRVMRMRQAGGSSLSELAGKSYLNDMELMQDFVRRILVRGVLCLQELMQAHAHLKVTLPHQQAAQPDPKEGMTMSQLREFSRVLGAFQERVEHLLEDAER